MLFVLMAMLVGFGFCPAMLGCHRGLSVAGRIWSLKLARAARDSLWFYVRIAIAISNHLKRIGFELRRRDSKLLQLRDQGEDLRPPA